MTATVSSRFLGRWAMSGLARLGDAMVPGDAELPSFRASGAIGHVDAVLENLEDSDRDGVLGEVVHPSMGLQFGLLDAELGTEMCHIYNEWLIDTLRSPRIVTPAMLPMWDVGRAIDELGFAHERRVLASERLELYLGGRLDLRNHRREHDVDSASSALYGRASWIVHERARAEREKDSERDDS